jgi:hypothetical protein
MTQQLRQDLTLGEIRDTLAVDYGYKVNDKGNIFINLKSKGNSRWNLWIDRQARLIIKEGSGEPDEQYRQDIIDLVNLLDQLAVKAYKRDKKGRDEELNINRHL